MKKLFLLVSLCTAVLAQAFNKNELESSIRSLDVASVKQIIADEKLTAQEYVRYFNLAEDMVRGREAWASKVYPMYDAATPYEGPSLKRLAPEAFIGWIGFKSGMICISGFMWAAFTQMGRRYENKEVWAAGIIASFSVVGKVIYDLRERFIADKLYKELLLKKYDDAVTIKQILYVASIVEA